MTTVISTVIIKILICIDSHSRCSEIRKIDRRHMETGERGFLITGKDEFLEPFREVLMIWG